MIGYIAKDRDKELYLHTEEPSYNDTYKAWFSTDYILNITNQFPEFDNISYKDKPIKVEINIKRI